MKRLASRKWDLAVASSRKSNYWAPVQMTWEELLDKLKNTIRTKETYAAYQQMDKAEQDAIKDVGGFVGGVLRKGRRKKGEILSRSLVCLDADFAPLDWWESLSMLYDFTCCLYSTHKHSPKTPRYRLVIPLDRPVSEEEYEVVARTLASWLGMDYFDETTYEASRLMYWPSSSQDGEFVFQHQLGSLVSVEEILDTYPDWREVRSWPRGKREVLPPRTVALTSVHPEEKTGIIGAFCKSYRLTQAIQTFLSHLYTPCDALGEDRYTYLKGSTTGGAIVYEDTYFYSHHGSDPAGGRRLNAFDLVRIHQFGHLDKSHPLEAPISTYPSYQAMLKWASEDPNVKKLLQAEIQLAFEETSSPKEKLQSDKALPDEPPKDYFYLNKYGKTCVNTSLLAQSIRQLCHYLVVRKQGYETEMLYWYKDGHYQLISASEFKGRIKRFIPTEIRRPTHWEDTYKELLTDVNYYSFESLDQDEHLINVKNGLYNLKTQKLEPHHPKYLSTIQLSCHYNPEAPKPEAWLAFIHRLTEGDMGLARILQEWFGLTLSNLPGYLTKKCLGLVGAVGNTGKTQYNNMLDHIIGRQHICATPIQDYEKTFGLGSIYGAKAILIDDQGGSDIQDSSNFKKLTGGGLVNCEIKGRQGFPYIFRGTLTFGCNDLPYFRDDKGDHLFERFIVIPCDNVIPKHERKGNILATFKQETDGIFLWALEGLQRLIKNDYQFSTSPRSEAALNDYVGMNDSFYRFIKEGYTLTGDTKDRILKKVLEEDYYHWARAQEVEPIKKKNISRRAAKHGIKLKKSNTLYYVGVKKRE